MPKKPINLCEPITLGIFLPPVSKGVEAMTSVHIPLLQIIHPYNTCLQNRIPNRQISLKLTT